MENIKNALNTIDTLGEHIRVIGNIIADNRNADDEQTRATLADCIDMYVARLHVTTEKAYRSIADPPPKAA